MTKIFIVATLFFMLSAVVGCSSKEYHMKDCKQVLDLDGQPTAERLCKKYSLWD